MFDDAEVPHYGSAKAVAAVLAIPGVVVIVGALVALFGILSEAAKDPAKTHIDLAGVIVLGALLAGVGMLAATVTILLLVAIAQAGHRQENLLRELLEAGRAPRDREPDLALPLRR